MTRYRVPVTDELLASRPWVPVSGFRLVSEDGPWSGHPHVTICTFDDDEAPAHLEGKLIEPMFRKDDVHGVTITGRTVIPE